MYSQKAKIYGFKQMLSAAIAFVTSISKTLHELMPDLPVFVLVSGDNNYIMDEKFKTVAKELYEKTPRFVIRFNSFERDQAQDTAVYNRYEFISQDEDAEEQGELARASIRRLCTYLNCNCTMVSSNFISAMMHLEMLYAIFSRENPFSYEYQGSAFNGAFTADSQDFNFPEQDSGTRNFNQNIDVKVQVHLYTPKINTIVLGKDYDYDGVEVTIQEKNVNNRVEVSEEETDYVKKDMIPEEIDVEGEIPQDGDDGKVKVVEPRRDDDIPYTSTNRETNV